MKTVSVKKLDELEKQGWKINPSDKNSISTQLSVAHAAAAIAMSLENIKDSISRVQMPETESIAPLLDNHYKLMVELLSHFCEFKPKKLDVMYTKRGVIDHVIVKEL